MVFGVLLVVPPAFAHAKHKLRLDTSLLPLDTALQSNDLVTAQALASSIFQQTVNALTATPANSNIIVDPMVVTTQSVALGQCKTAYAIADSFYRHADLADAEQWATTATTADTLSDPYARRARVLLGNIAYAMDRDDVAAAHFQSVIALPNLYPEQASAYAGLLDVLLSQKQDDQAAQWVQNGQAQFAGAGDLQLAFLQDAERVLKHRNHTLWRVLDQQIVNLFPDNAPSRLQALRELASNARKFERWPEAETNYAALCAVTLPTARETVDTWFLLAECQAKQSEDVTTTLSNLTAVCAGFPDTEDCDYGMYRLGKFYEEHGNLDAAVTNYELLATSPTASTWASAALHELGAVKEKQGDLPGALQIYLQYPQRFPQNERFVVQSYASALNVADALGDTNAANLAYGAITNSAGAIQDYNVLLNISLYFDRRDTRLSLTFLESGFALAHQALLSTSDPAQRALIHFRMVRRMTDVHQFQRILDHLEANASEFPGLDADSSSDANHLECYGYKALALYGTTNQQDAVALLDALLIRAQGNADLEGKFGENLAILNQSNDSAAAAQLFQWVAQKYPSHPWASFGRLQLAIQAFNRRDFAAARKLTDDVINGLPERTKSVWIQRAYWGAIYLRGCCLQSQGLTQDGAALKQLAMTKVPTLSIQGRLNSQ
jgi:TolA-binding protein